MLENNHSQHTFESLMSPVQELKQVTEIQAGPIGINALATGINERELERLANTDLLTGVLNRRGFTKALGEVLSSSSLDSERFVVMYMDLDGFKDLNDEFGHAEGDRVLRHVGQRLNLREHDIVGRIGGDEFVLLIDKDAVSTERRAQRESSGTVRRNPRTRDEVIEGLSGHIRSEIHEASLSACHEWQAKHPNSDSGKYGVGVSIGVADINGHKTAEEVISIADTEMYKNKQARKKDKINLTV